MTRLNQAFIKAYSKSTAAPPPPHTNAAAASVAPSQPQPIDEAANTAAGPSLVSDVAEASPWFDSRGHDAARLDNQHAAVSPHWSAPAIATFSTWDTSSAVAMPQAEPQPQSEASIAPPISNWSRIAPSLEPAPALEPPQTAWPTPGPSSLPVEHLRFDGPVGSSAAAADVAKQPIVEPPPAPQSEPAAQPQIWRAAFEVDSLLWPEVNYSLAAACRSQWEQLMKELVQAGREGQKIVLVSSYARGEGRTSLVLCLAHLLSQKQNRVAIVDADFQRPQIARQLKLLPACGWDEVVRDSQPLTEAWIESTSDGVTLLPLGQRADAMGLTGNPRLKQTLQALRGQHDVVLIDAGAISDSNDREMLALLAATAEIDSAMLVRDVRSTSWDTLHDSQKTLDAIGIGRWDVVENFAD
jgi:Mrp family chromosome partitioning ATPase